MLPMCELIHKPHEACPQYIVQNFFYVYIQKDTKSIVLWVIHIEFIRQCWSSEFCARHWLLHRFAGERKTVKIHLEPPTPPPNPLGIICPRFEFYCKNLKYCSLMDCTCFPGSSVGKESAYNSGDPGSIPGWERSPGEGMATHSSILAWKTSWTEKPGRMHIQCTFSSILFQLRQHPSYRW